MRELTSLDVGECKESDAKISVDRPLLRLAIRAAAVVDEASRVSLGAGVDHSILNRGGGQQKGREGKVTMATVLESWRKFSAQERQLSDSECHLSECKHVKVGHVIFVSAFDPLLALLRVDHLAHVLSHKVALKEKKKKKRLFRLFPIRVPTQNFKTFQGLCHGLL